MLFMSNPAPGKTKQKKFVFHHIGKTGGTTFSGILYAMTSLKGIDAEFLPVQARLGTEIMTPEHGRRSYANILKNAR